ncbi:MAG: DUF3732 domain-containing protein [Chitinophagaceae bacterium]|nr:DUF3732 domain-containing protein [Chitinophagaceae bacterium]
MQLVKIILWPLNTSFPYRSIDLQKGKVNYIIGGQHTGKSSIWQIVDYCLGSSKLRVPVGVARDLVSWYGILLEEGMEQILVARKNTSLDGAKSEYLFLQGKELVIPDIPQRNQHSERSLRTVFSHDLEQFKKRIDKSLLDELENQKIGPISYRDLLITNHLMQYALVNPSSFVTEGNYISVIKLKKILPIILYPNDNSYYKLKRSIQNKVEVQMKILDKEVGMLRDQMDFLFREANKFKLARNYTDPTTDISRSAENLRFELNQILQHNKTSIASELKENGPASLSSDTMNIVFLLGKIEQCLVFAKALDRLGQLSAQLKLINSDIRKREENAGGNTEIQSLSDLIQLYAKTMELDFQQYVPIFDDKESMLKFQQLDEEIYLYQLGNPQQYVGYNVALYLAFHEIFVVQHTKFIFPFLFIDHPSLSFTNESESDKNAKIRSFYRALDLCAKRLSPAFQIIVLERKIPDELANMSNSVLIENWPSSESDTLIPANWKQ